MELRRRLQDLLEAWRQEGTPARWELTRLFAEVIAWKNALRIPGLWQRPPLLLTATLDDGWGHGLQVIELCARAAGMRVLSLGLLQSPEKIVADCRKHLPELLGLTVLQLDSEPDLAFIGENLPGKTRLVAGGAPFQIDPDLASRVGVHKTARDAAGFLEFLLTFEEDSQSRG